MHQLVRPRKLFCSDLHFGDKKSLTIDDRPFDTVDEMREELIVRWNKNVQEYDDVYVLGDFFKSLSEEEIISIISRLNGKITVIKGNHDKWARNRNITKLLKEVAEYKAFKEHGIIYTLSHYPNVWHSNHWKPNAYHFYGHVHQTFEEREVLKAILSLQKAERGPYTNIFNVGCMLPYMDYAPQTLEHIVTEGRKYQKQEFQKMEAKLLSK